LRSDDVARSAMPRGGAQAVSGAPDSRLPLALAGQSILAQ
jgi:hypothetical protein